MFHDQNKHIAQLPVSTSPLLGIFWRAAISTILRVSFKEPHSLCPFIRARIFANRGFTREVMDSRHTLDMDNFAHAVQLINKLPQGVFPDEGV